MHEFIEVIGPSLANGTVPIQGAKNAALPLLLASMLTDQPCTFENLPNLEDVSLSLQLLEHFGAQTEFNSDKVTVHTPVLSATEASYSVVKALRASFWVLGPLLARARTARVALPGGDIIGARPVDLHLSALSQMGADIKVRHGVVFAEAPKGLKPADIFLRFPSVGATHQILMAATLVPGVTTIHGAAREPEVVALAKFLSSLGAEIDGAGSNVIHIRGTTSPGKGFAKLDGDRIVAGTYLAAGVISGGPVKVTGVFPDQLTAFLDLLEEGGCIIEKGEDWISVRRSTETFRAINAATGPFPALATDLQAPLLTILTTAEGKSSLTENIFEGRFGIISELSRMGAKISVDGKTAYIEGVPRLSGAYVEGMDLRAAASLVIAGLAAEGLTRVHEVHHLRRGYEHFEQNLRSLGAQVYSRISDAEDFMFIGC
jgi:UDP-N-acetylglucosamine 1-carboxyvinyltransferase